MPHILFNIKMMKLVFLLTLWCYSSSAATSTNDDEPSSSNLRQRQRNLQINAPVLPIIVPRYADPLFTNLTIPATAATQGMWSKVYNWPIVPIHAAILPDGKVVTYGVNINEAVHDGRYFVVWDPRMGPSAGAFKVSPNPDYVDSFCSSGVLMSDGTLLVSGGSSGRNGTSRESSIFDYRTMSASKGAQLNKARWYGTMIRLPDGRALMTGGTHTFVGGGFADPIGNAPLIGSTPEIYSPTTRTWSLLPGGFSLDAFGAENNRYWYPRQWVSPTGTVFGISTDKMWELNVNGNGFIRTIGNFKTKPDNIAKPNVGPTSTAVMYDSGKIIQVGGNGYHDGYGSPSSAAATLFDITNIGNNDVKITETAPMQFGRQWASASVLPDGKVLVSGGTRNANNGDPDAVYPVEIWNPTTGTWTTGASASRIRVYHSTQIVLPNGAVFSGGGGVPGPVANFDAQIYYPPYLFRSINGQSVLAPRPRIFSMTSTKANYGGTIDLQVGFGDFIKEISFKSLPSATHSFDSNQRRIKLRFTTNNNLVRVQMPSSGNIAPPGYYYLNVINTQGVPSLAVIIGLSATAPAAPTAPATLPGFVIKEATGPVVIEAVARFDSFAGGAWQRVFDFGNGPAMENIWMGQCASSADMCFGVFKNGHHLWVNAPNSIVNGQTATWRGVVDDTGLIWIEKNGVRLAQVQGHIPSNLIRTSKLIGRSNWVGDSPLNGAVLGLSITNNNVAAKDVSLINIVKQITGPFTARAWAQFDDLSGQRVWQRIFDFGNGPLSDNILCGQLAGTRDFVFDIYQGGVSRRVIAPNAIEPGKLTLWRVGVDTNGWMWIEKDGELIANARGFVPRNIQRTKNLVGASNFVGDSTIRGVVLGLRIS